MNVAPPQRPIPPAHDRALRMDWHFLGQWCMHLARVPLCAGAALNCRLPKSQMPCWHCALWWLLGLYCVVGEYTHRAWGWL
jgi:hypothetical protein